MTRPVDPDDLARVCVEAMLTNDPASAGLGMRLEAVRAGFAQVSMTVRPDMANGHGIAHGGYVFCLADTAFACACNGYDEVTLAQHCQITYLRPARLGERLTAEAVERHREGRNGLYDVTVRNSAGEVVAEFRGAARSTGQPILPERGAAS